MNDIPQKTAREEWDAYVREERTRAEPILRAHGYALDDDQPHTLGERYLMQAVTTASGRKLILLGHRTSDGTRVVIKVTRDRGGVQELQFERTARAMLKKIRFAYDVFHTPAELLFVQESGLCIAVYEYIAQERSFLERPVEEQFALALTSFKAQERAHATTASHLREIRRVYESFDGARYLATFAGFIESVRTSAPPRPELTALLTRALETLTRDREVIEQYCGFLTHTDFVPHNIRVVGETLYLLDFSSLRFGNKYEGWARFINFMVLYNPPLAEALITYVAQNRTPEETVALHLLRLYRLGEICRYYVHAEAKSEGDVRTLNGARVTFWSAVLESVLNKQPLAPSVREEYIKLRDSLRSEDEKKRQVGLH